MGTAGRSLDASPAFDRLAELQVLSLLIWGDLDFPHIQHRCRHVIEAMSDASAEILTGVAHLPSLECPASVTTLITGFLDRIGGTRRR